MKKQNKPKATKKLRKLSAKTAKKQKGGLGMAQYWNPEQQDEPGADFGDGAGGGAGEP